MIARNILVTDGEQRAALALVRSLGRYGHRVYVCSVSGKSLAGASRYCRAELPAADALADPAGFVRDVTAHVWTWGVDTLMPVSEAALLALLPVRERFPELRIPFPDASAFKRISDKEAVAEAAKSIGIAIPNQRVAHGRDELEELAADFALRFPLVLKPARSVSDSGNGKRAKTSVLFATRRAQVRDLAMTLDPSSYPILLQQRVTGPGVGIFLLRWEGKVHAVFAHRRIREKPPSGGISVYRESIVADAGIIERSKALLDYFGFNGVAMVEYKIDRATGTPYLMEVNGRFWGSLQLAIDAGVDFPQLLLDASAGEPAPKLPPRYKTGIRSRWWWGDVDQLLIRLRRRRSELLPLPADAPSRAAAVRDFLILWRPGDRNEILRMTDPRPFLRETVSWILRK